MWTVILSLIALPIAVVLIDALAGLRARWKTYQPINHWNDNFTVLVPIWGRVKYLENVAYLADYRQHVTLCTTGDETPEFYDELQVLADQHGFQIFRDQPTRKHVVAQTQKQRATSGTIRDRVIRNALAEVTTAYVIPLDADSHTKRPLAQLVGELEGKGYDIASITLVPTNTDTLLAKLQRFEYRLAMQFRFVANWLISGACHVAKTAVLTDVMNRHSLFFQGNDVETGLIAAERGYKVGHIPFEVFTTVPSTFRPWLRQRLAWAGGEFRLFIVNARFALKHPFFWFYGGVLTILAFPLRWLALSQPSWALLVAIGLYVVAVVYLHLKNKSGWILLVPLYALASSLILTPLGILWYFYMAIKDENFGVIRPNRVPAATQLT